MQKIKQIFIKVSNTLKKSGVLFLLINTAKLAVSALAISFVFYRQPKSANILACFCTGLILLKLLIYKTNSPASKMRGHWSSWPRLNHVEGIFLSCLICDILFDKNLAILCLITASLATFGTDIVEEVASRFAKKLTPAVALLMSLAGFRFVYLKYNYLASTTTIVISCICAVVACVVAAKKPYIEKTTAISLTTSITLYFLLTWVIQQ